MEAQSQALATQTRLLQQICDLLDAQDRYWAVLERTVSNDVIPIDPDPDEVLDNHRVGELIATFTSAADAAFSSTADVECGAVHSYAATNTEIDTVEAAAATRVGALESWRPRVESHASVDLFDSGDDSNELRYEELVTADNWGGLFDGDGAANAEITDDWDKPSTASTNEPSLVHVLHHGPPLLVESRLHALRVAQELGARPRAGGRAHVLTGEDDVDHQPSDLGLGRAALVPIPGLHQALKHVVVPGSDGGAPARPDDLDEDTLFDGTDITELPITCSTSGLTAELAMAHYDSHLPSDKGGSVASWQPARSLALAVHVESQCQQASSARGTPAMASMGKMSVGDLTEADLKGKHIFVCAEIHEPPDENQNSTNDILSTSCDTAVDVVKRCQRLFPLADSTDAFDATVAARVTQMAVPSPARNATPTGSSPKSTACGFPCDNKSSKQLQRGGPSLDGSLSDGASFRVGMQFRQLSGCYQCHMVVVPVSGSVSMRATICPWPDCGDVFVRQESL
jgi:hypothetical protein